MKIEAKSIPHNQQRYPTLGDYWEEPGAVQFRISTMEHPEYEVMVLIHELIEYYLIKKAGISVAAIDKFDKEMENDRENSHFVGVPYIHRREGNIIEKCRDAKGNVNADEPGICPEAPYHKQHMFATKVEKMLCRAFDLNWKKYNDYISKL